MELTDLVYRLGSNVGRLQSAVPFQQRTHSLSGEQILGALVQIADGLDEQFKPELLDEWWSQAQPNNFMQEIWELGTTLGYNRDGNKPAWGWNAHHHGFNKDSVEKLIPVLTMVDKERFENLEPNEEFQIVAYNIIYNPLGGYFNREELQKKYGYKAEGVLNRLRKGLCDFHEGRLRSQGLHEIKETQGAVINILKSRQISDPNKPVAILSPPGVLWKEDVYEYKGRLFTLPRDHHKPQQTDAHTMNLLWGMSIYTRRIESRELIGYIQFNEERRNRMLSM